MKIIIKSFLCQYFVTVKLDFRLQSHENSFQVKCKIKNCREPLTRRIIIIISIIKYAEFSMNGITRVFCCAIYIPFYTTTMKMRIWDAKTVTEWNWKKLFSIINFNFSLLNCWKRVVEQFLSFWCLKLRMLKKRRMYLKDFHLFFFDNKNYLFYFFQFFIHRIVRGTKKIYTTLKLF